MKRILICAYIALTSLSSCKQKTSSNELETKEVSSKQSKKNNPTELIGTKVFTQSYGLTIADATKEEFEKLPKSKFSDFNFLSKSECLQSGRLKIISSEEIQLKLKNGSYTTIKSENQGFGLDDVFGYDADRDFYVLYKYVEEGGENILIDGVTGTTRIMSNTKEDFSLSPNKKVFTNLLNWDLRVYQKNKTISQLFTINFPSLIGEKWSTQEVRWLNGNTLITKIYGDKLFKKVQFIKMSKSELANEKERVEKFEDEIIAFENNPKAMFSLLKKELLKNPKRTFNFSFDKLQKAGIINILKSSDNKVRFYTWDNRSGGSWRYFDGVYQINDNGYVNTIPFPENSKDHNNLFIRELHIKKANNKTYYITEEVGIYSGKSNEFVAKTFEISSILENYLNPVSLFKTSKKSYYEIKVNFDPTTNTDNREIIKYDNSSIKFNVINKNLEVSNKYLNYIWNGKAFNYEGITQ